MHFDTTTLKDISKRCIPVNIIEKTTLPRIYIQAITIDVLKSREKNKGDKT